MIDKEKIDSAIIYLKWLWKTQGKFASDAKAQVDLLDAIAYLKSLLKFDDHAVAERIAEESVLYSEGKYANYYEYTQAIETILKESV